MRHTLTILLLSISIYALDRSAPQSRIIVDYKLLKGGTIEILAEYLYNQRLFREKIGCTLSSSTLFRSENLSLEPELYRGASDINYPLHYGITADQNRIAPSEKETLTSKELSFQTRITLKLFKQSLLNPRYLKHTSFNWLIRIYEAKRNIFLFVNVPFSLKSHD